MQHRRWAVSVITIMFGISTIHCPLANARNSHSKLAEGKYSGEEFTQDILSGPVSKEHLLYLMAVTGADSESLRAIHSDLTAATPPGTHPMVALVNRELVFNGKRTGVHITKFQPFNVMFKGRYWAAETGANTEKNYQSLKRFLTPEVSALWQLLLPRGIAQDKQSPNERQESWDKAALTYVAGALTTGRLVYAVVGSGFGAGAVAIWGGLAAANLLSLPATDRKQKSENAEWLTSFLKHDFIPRCSEVGITLYSKDSDEAYVRLGFENEGKGKSSAQVPFFVDENGADHKNIELTPSQRRVLNVLRDCKSKEDAKALEAQLKGAKKALTPLTDQEAARMVWPKKPEQPKAAVQ